MRGDLLDRVLLAAPVDSDGARWNQQKVGRFVAWKPVVTTQAEDAMAWAKRFALAAAVVAVATVVVRRRQYIDAAFTRRIR